MNVQEFPHRRYNALTGDWNLVSPHRTLRPWQGKQENADFQEHLPYDPTCYLCPGNVRASGVQNPKYTDTFVFTNDFPALLPDDASGQSVEDIAPDSLFQRQPIRGTCRVICFSPRHDLT